MTIKALLAQSGSPLAKCGADESVGNATKTMAAAGVNALAVVSANGHLAGIITDHDIIRAMATRGGHFPSEPVREWMSPNVVTCSPEEKLSDALKSMGRHRIRHLVVVDNGETLAVVGIREILAQVHQNDEMEKNVLRDITISARSGFAA